MKVVLVLGFLLNLCAVAQDPTAFLNNFDNKVYSLKNKGVKDFVVDVISPKITKQLNEQLIFGQVNEVIFRTYWTANPERVAIEIIGLPDGFKEIKEELKLSIMSILDSILPPGIQQRFAGYKFSPTNTPHEYEAKDTTGIAQVQSFILRFDSSMRLVNIEGKKAVGELFMTPRYEKEGFSDGKWVLKSLKTTQSESGQTMTVTKDLTYGTSQGISVVTRLNVVTEQRGAGDKAKSLNLEETIEFKNYKINSGEGLKYFLGEGSELKK